jgi:hypothetical protein
MAAIDGLFLASHPIASLSLRPLRAVFRARLLAVCDAEGILGAANDVITNTREILNASAAYKNHRVLLEVVTDTGYICGNFNTVG